MARWSFFNLHSTMASINQLLADVLYHSGVYLHSTMASINPRYGEKVLHGKYIYIPLWHLLILEPRYVGLRKLLHLHSTMASINPRTDQHDNQAGS